MLQFRVATYIFWILIHHWTLPFNYFPRYIWVLTSQSFYWTVMSLSPYSTTMLFLSQSYAPPPLCQASCNAAEQQYEAISIICVQQRQQWASRPPNPCSTQLFGHPRRTKTATLFTTDGGVENGSWNDCNQNDRASLRYDAKERSLSFLIHIVF